MRMRMYDSVNYDYDMIMKVTFLASIAIPLQAQSNMYVHTHSECYVSRKAVSKAFLQLVRAGAFAG